MADALCARCTAAGTRLVKGADRAVSAAGYGVGRGKCLYPVWSHIGFLEKGEQQSVPGGGASGRNLRRIDVSCCVWRKNGRGDEWEAGSEREDAGSGGTRLASTGAAVKTSVACWKGVNSNQETLAPDRRIDGMCVSFRGFEASGERNKEDLWKLTGKVEVL